jgi:hypothetical protein
MTILEGIGPRARARITLIGSTTFIRTRPMPFKSQAQRRKFAEMMVKGEISPETFEEWNRETGSARLPEHVAHKPARKKTSKNSPRKNTASRARKAATPARKKKATKKGGSKRRTR